MTPEKQEELQGRLRNILVEAGGPGQVLALLANVCMEAGNADPNVKSEVASGWHSIAFLLREASQAVLNLHHKLLAALHNRGGK